MTPLPTITIYTDGACHPNPGPGGWAAILLHLDRDPQELSGAEQFATNNRMELRAAVEGLRSLDTPYQVELHTDSKYLKEGITTWLPQWEQNNWQTSQKEAVKNQDLWQSLAVQQRRHQVKWHWVKGHANNQWNERADRLAAGQIPRQPLPLDDTVALHIFTAVSYAGKTRHGAWAALLRYGDHVKSLSGRVNETSSNRLHIQAAVAGLEAVKRPLPIHIYTTSDYLKDGATRWVKGWVAQNWQTKEGKPVSHRDLWEIVSQLCQQYHIKWHVVDKEAAPTEMTQVKQLAQEAAR